MPKPIPIPEKIIETLKNLIPQAHFSYQMISEDLGDDAAERGNVAIAVVSIDGYQSGDFISFSKNSAAHKRKEDKQFYSDIAAVIDKNTPGQHQWLGKNIQTNNHTEPKILLAIVNKYNLAQQSQIGGKIAMVSTRDVCGSCKGIIDRFKGTYPNILIYTLGLQQRPLRDESPTRKVLRGERILAPDSKRNKQYPPQLMQWQ